jgi:predicted phosphodiesterase
MRIAIISDIHSNLHALEAVLKDIEKQVPDQIFCLGDIVGYGAYPRDCLRLVKANCSLVLKGNHDDTASYPKDLDSYYDEARISLEWTRDQLEEEDIDYLRSLPYVNEGKLTSYVHASLNEPENWEYIEYLEALQAHFSKQKTEVCFAGHTHLPAIFGAAELESADLTWNNPLPLPRDQRILVNPGSVGQPRDSDPRACYVIYDEVQRIVTYRRVRYEVERAMNSIRAVKMPAFLADRLAKGE